MKLFSSTPFRQVRKVSPRLINNRGMHRVHEQVEVGEVNIAVHAWRDTEVSTSQILIGVGPKVSPTKPSVPERGDGSERAVEAVTVAFGSTANPKPYPPRLGL